MYTQTKNQFIQKPNNPYVTTVILSLREEKKTIK